MDLYNHQDVCERMKSSDVIKNELPPAEAAGEINKKKLNPYD